jgi:C4-dicarboxylate-specific signal transduction histidine kinase
VENEAFRELRAFATAALGWMRDVRMRERDKRRDKKRSRAPRDVASARQALMDSVGGLPVGKKVVMEHAVKRYDVAREKELRILHDELELYRTLGSVGTTLSVFAHEGGRFVSQIALDARRLLQRHRCDDNDTLTRALERIGRACESLQAYMTVPIKLLTRSKRRMTTLDLNSTIRDVISLLAPLARAAKITIDDELASTAPTVRATTSAVEAIVANLLTNAMAALTDTHGPLADRKVIVRTQVFDHEVFMEIADNGPGLRNIAPEDIWLPGKTTRAGGVGLGLTIVRDAAIDLGGDVKVTCPGALGGADFVVRLPLSGDSL